MLIPYTPSPVLVVVLASALLAACTSAPKPPPVPLTSTVPPLEQFMSDAARAKTEGADSTERETYHKAAQAYPTSKQPWLALAEGYFNSADYGRAILAAQEVIQRDPADRVASSLLAVSGLRVSAGALASMRQQQNLGTDTRRQAEDLVRTLRESLGEPLLVPTPVEVAPAPPVRRQPVRRPPPIAADKTPATVSAPAAAPAAAKPPANPFQTLIK